MEHPNETEEAELAYNKSKKISYNNSMEETYTTLMTTIKNNAKFPKTMISTKMGQTRAYNTTIISKRSTENLNNDNKGFKKFKEKWKNVQMNRLNTKVGFMFASKPIVQLITNPFIGPLTNR